MGLLDSITGTIVMKYKADTEQAKAAIKGLSGEQKKAAKQAAEDTEAQGKAAQGMFEKYAKGAAIVAGSFLIARQGLNDFEKDARLRAGSAKVNIDELSKAAGGLKTEWELMAIAQAGSQGAWKLTTQQIGFVIEGMRALEKKGYDATEVQNQLTESLKKGKLEGLDKFGLSAKDLGNSTANLRSLMKQLAGAANEVGHNFDKAGDAAVRARVKFENMRDKAGTNLGKGADYVLSGAEHFGAFLGAVANGDDEVGMESVGRYYMHTDDQMRRAITKGDRDYRRALVKQEKDTTAAWVNANFRWMKVAQVQIANDDEIVKQIMDEYDASIALRKQRAADAKSGAASLAERRKVQDARLLGLANLSLGQGDELTLDQESNRAARQAAQRAEDARRVNGGDTQSLLTSITEIEQSLEKAKDDDRKTFLESMFGPLDDFDLYREALSTLGSTAQNVGASIYKTWVEGGEVSAKALKKLVASEIATEGQKLQARAISAILTGTYNTISGDPRGPGQVATGLAMEAGAIAIGAIARSMGGGGASTGGGSKSRPGHRDLTVDTGMGGGGSAVVVVGDGWADDSPRYRAATTRRAINLANGYRAPSGVTHG